MIWIGEEAHREEFFNGKGPMGCSEKAAGNNSHLYRQKRALEA